MAVSPILDRNGRNFSYDDFFQSGSRTFRPSQPRRMYDSAYDHKLLVSECSWRQLLSAGRFLFANSPVIRGALLEQALYSFPVEARYRGADKAWGEMAEEWLWNWKQNPTFRGETYDYCTVSRIRMLGYKIDGDIFNALTFDEAGYPKLQLIRAHRISNGNRPYIDNILDDGPFKGRRISNGVIVDDYGRTIGYKLVDRDSMGQDVMQWMSADSFFPTYRPDYSDELRGVSHLASSVRSFADLKRLHDYELIAMQVQSSIAVSEKNESGSPDDLGQRMMASRRGVDTETNTEPISIQEFDGGTTKYFKSGTGSGLEFHQPDTPGESWQKFFDRVTSMALYGIEWDPNFALAIKEPGGAWARTILEKVNRATRHNFETEVRTCKRVDAYALAKAIDLGILPMPSDGDFLSWEYAMGVPRITADIGNEQQAKREAYKMGLVNLHDIAVEGGMDWEDKREQRELETTDLCERAQTLKTQFPELSFHDALSLLEQRNPNPSGSQASASEPKTTATVSSATEEPA